MPKGRKPGFTTPAIAEAARRNGAKRVCSKLAAELLEQIGAPPVDSPIKLARWYTTILAHLSWNRLKGIAGTDVLAEEIRANASASGRVLPHDIVFTAARVVQEDDDELAADGGPVEVVRNPHKKATRAIQ